MAQPKVKEQFAVNLAKAIADSEFKNFKTLKKLGKVFGVSGTMVYYWLRGQKMPSTENIAIIAIKLAVNVEWLLTNRGTMRVKEGISYKTATLISAFEGMPAREQGELIRYAAFLADRLGDKLTSQELLGIAQAADQDPARPN